MNYESLMIEAESHQLLVKEKALKSHDGRIKGKRIAIRKDISTAAEKSCVLAEELGHYYTTVGDILDQSKAENRKQELRARLWAYNKQIGLIGIVNAYKNGCTSLHEAAEFLGVTEEFFCDAIRSYHAKYGICASVDNYVVFFEPALSVMKKMNID